MNALDSYSPVVHLQKPDMRKEEQLDHSKDTEQKRSE